MSNSVDRDHHRVTTQIADPLGRQQDDQVAEVAVDAQGGESVAQDGDSRWKIGVWGAAQSGKTVFLGALYDAMQYHNPYPEWKLAARSGNPENFESIRYLSSQVVGNENKPEKSPNPVTYLFTIKREAKLFGPPSLVADFEWIDQAGEQIMINPERILGDLKGYDGVLVFLDPRPDIRAISPNEDFLAKYRDADEDRFDETSFYRESLDRLAYHLTDKTTHRVGKVVFFLVTKVDACEAHWRKRKEGKILLEDIMLEGGINWISSKFSRWEAYATSATGIIEQDGEYLGPNVREEGKPGCLVKDRKHHRPYNVIEPVIDMIETLEKIRH